MEIPGRAWPKLKLNILGITLARGGSKSIKNKNITLINKHPLIYYTIKEAKKSKFLSNYIVSTDSKKIKKVCNKYGVDTPFLRPKKYSSDKSSSASAIKHSLIMSEKFYDKKFDYIIELMNTNPLKSYNDIDNVIKLIIKKKADSVIAVNQLFDHHPARIKKIKNGRLYDFVIKEKLESRRQDLKPQAFIRSGSIYAMSRKFVLNEKRYVSSQSIPYIMKPERVINIDTNEDLYLAKLKISEK
jgi:CMP-N,N'-diacetyllegionaminic acid synthase